MFYPSHPAPGLPQPASKSNLPRGGVCSTSDIMQWERRRGSEFRFRTALAARLFSRHGRQDRSILWKAIYFSDLADIVAYFMRAPRRVALYLGGGGRGVGVVDRALGKARCACFAPKSRMNMDMTITHSHWEERVCHIPFLILFDICGKTHSHSSTKPASSSGQKAYLCCGRFLWNPNSESKALCNTHLTHNFIEFVE